MAGAFNGETWQPGDWIMKRFLRYLTRYKLALATAGLLTLLVTALTLPYPYIVRLMLDEALPTKNLDYLYILMAIFCSCFLARGLVTFVQRYLLQRIGMRITVDFRKDCFAHLQTLSLKFYEERQTGSIAARISEDTGLIYNLVSQVLVNVLSDFFVVLSVLVIIFMTQWKLALLVVLVLPFFVLNYTLHRRRLRKLARRHRRNWFRVVGFITERVAGARLVHSFAMEDKEIANFNRGVERDFHNFNSLTFSNARLLVISDMISSFGGLIVLGVGGWMVIKGMMTVGSLVMFNTLIGFLFAPIVRLSDVNLTIDRANAAIEKIYEILDTPSFAKETPGSLDLPVIRGLVEFKHVKFSYNAGRAVLEDVCLKAEPGQMVALVGASGAGKSTLINLLCRFYDVDQGEILVDGFDIRKVKLKSLRNQIGVVMQENYLFSGTVLDTIRYGVPLASLDEVRQAADSAHAHEFITRLPSGYHTRIGERGVRLSGGQRQRLAIARAILKDPKLIIFDEATSALDSESEILIQNAMERFTKGRTTFVIAHRLSTIRRAHKIVVMEEGRIAEEGDHESLMAKGGLYQKFHNLQFKGEENPA
jgi:subfamily B ATP-binding cassette protein MsbA